MLALDVRFGSISACRDRLKTTQSGLYIHRPSPNEKRCLLSDMKDFSNRTVGFLPVRLIKTL